MILRSLIVFLFASGAFAQTFPAAQQNLRARTLEVTTEITAILDEFSRNNLADSPEVQTVTAIRSVLSNLSERDMETVITLLRQSQLPAAYAQQKGILAQLNQLLLEYRKQQTIQNLAQRIDQLARRQHANLKATIELARATQGKSRQSWESLQWNSLLLQQQEQAALRSDISQAMVELASAAEAAPRGAADRIRAQIALAKQAGLLEASASAAEDLAAANLYRAAGNEKISRDQLRSLARALAAPKDHYAALRDAAEKLARAAQEQADIATQAKASAADPAKAAQLEPREADAVDEAEQLSRDLAPLAPAASPVLASAQDAMQKARSALLTQAPGPAAQNAQEAQKHLESAQNQIESELAKAKSKPGESLTPEQRQAMEQELAKQQAARDGIAKAIEDQQKVEDQTRAAEAKNDQQGLQNAGNEQQKVAQSPALTQQSSRPLSDAKSKMQSASSKLKQPDAKGALHDQQAAMSDLRQAKAELDQKIASQQQKLGQASNASAKLDEIAKQLGAAQKQLDQTASEMGKSSELSKASGSLSQLSQQVGKLAAEDGGSLSDDASNAMEQTRAALSQASASAGGNMAAPAQEQTAQAQQSMAQARAAVQLAQAGLTSRGNSSQAKLAPEPPPLPPPPGDGGGSGQGSSAGSASTGGTTDAKAAKPGAGAAEFVGLPERDRQVLSQSASDPVPPQYAPMVEQYRRNLAGESKVKGNPR